MNITHRVLLLRLARLFREGMSDQALYEATRGVWKVGSRRLQAEYALAVAGGVVREVYRIDGWHPAGTTAYATRSAPELRREGRWEFTGEVAPDDVRRHYVGGRVEEFYPQGTQNPVRYVNL